MMHIKLGIYNHRYTFPHIEGTTPRYRWDREVFINDNEFKQIIYGSSSGPYNIEIYYQDKLIQGYVIQDELIQGYVILDSLVIDRSVYERADEWLHITGLDRVYKYKELY